ncbi:MAG: hypothetical protein WDZ35_11255 [Crocinitomicaceae bacterium]
MFKINKNTFLILLSFISVNVYSQTWEGDTTDIPAEFFQVSPDTVQLVDQINITEIITYDTVWFSNDSLTTNTHGTAYSLQPILNIQFDVSNISDIKFIHFEVISLDGHQHRPCHLKRRPYDSMIAVNEIVNGLVNYTVSNCELSGQMQITVTIEHHDKRMGSTTVKQITI